MNPRVSAAISRNGGVIARAQCLDLGVSPAEIRTLLRNQSWIRVRRGVYAPMELWETLDEYVGRPRLRARAAVLTMRRGWVLSHDSSAHEWEMSILCPKDPLVHVTRPGWTNAWTENGIKHHLAGFGEHEVHRIGRVPVLGLARTAVDLAREHGFDAGVVACDSALRMGVERSALTAAYERMDHWTGVGHVRASVAFADPGAENPHESLGRILVAEAGLDEPETQFPLMTPRGLLWCDIRVGNHIIETDGRIKYRAVADGGVATMSPEEVVWEERKRERLIRDEQLGVTRLTWADYWGRNRDAAIERLRADAHDTEARYGPILHERLARQADRIREEFGVRRPGA